MPPVAKYSNLIRNKIKEKINTELVLNFTVNKFNFITHRPQLPYWSNELNSEIIFTFKILGQILLGRVLGSSKKIYVNRFKY